MVIWSNVCDLSLKGACSAMKQYKAPDFEVALYEVEDVITYSSVTPDDPDEPTTWY